MKVKILTVDNLNNFFISNSLDRQFAYQERHRRHRGWRWIF